MKKIVAALFLVCCAGTGSHCFAQQQPKSAWTPEHIEPLQALVRKAAQTKNWTPEAKKAKSELDKLEQPNVAPSVGIMMGATELNEGLLAYSKGQLDTADSYFTKVLHMRENAYGPNDWLLVQPLTYLAMCYEKKSQNAQAIESYKRAIANGQAAMAAKQLSDPLAPRELVPSMLVQDLNEITKLYIAAGRLKEAEAACWQAVQVEKASPEGANYRSITNNQYRQILRKTGRWADSMTVQPGTSK